MRKTNDTGIKFIKNAEGVELKAYKDSGGVWTIGVGHTAGVHAGQIITEEQAEEFLREDLEDAETAVNDAVLVDLNQHQFNALVSLTFNIGGRAFAKSTLVRQLNVGNYDGAADQFLRWNKDNGVIVAGLTSRRQKERALFLMPASEEEPEAEPIVKPTEPTPTVVADQAQVIQAAPAPREPISKPGDIPISVTAVEPQKSNAKKSIIATIIAAVSWVGLNIQNFFQRTYEATQNNPLIVVAFVCSSLVILIIYWKYQERLERLDARRSQQAHELTLEQMRLAADPDRYSVKVVKQ